MSGPPFGDLCGRRDHELPEVRHDILERRPLRRLGMPTLFDELRHLCAALIYTCLKYTRLRLLLGYARLHCELYRRRLGLPTLDVDMGIDMCGDM